MGKVAPLEKLVKLEAPEGRAKTEALEVNLLSGVCIQSREERAGKAMNPNVMCRIKAEAALVTLAYLALMAKTQRVRAYLALMELTEEAVAGNMVTDMEKVEVVEELPLRFQGLHCRARLGQTALA